MIQKVGTEHRIPPVQDAAEAEQIKLFREICRERRKRIYLAMLDSLEFNYEHGIGRDKFSQK